MGSAGRADGCDSSSRERCSDRRSRAGRRRRSLGLASAEAALTRREQERAVEQVLAEVLPSDGVSTWWHVPNSRLAGFTPSMCLEQGFFEPVYKLALSYLDPSFS